MSTVEHCKYLVEEAFHSPGKWADNLARAETLLSTEVAQDPENSLLLTCLGSVLCDQGQYEKAAKVLRRAVELGSTDRNTFLSLGVAILNSGAHAEAQQFFARARSLEASSQSWLTYFDPQAH